MVVVGQPTKPNKRVRTQWSVKVNSTSWKCSNLGPQSNYWALTLSFPLWAGRFTPFAHWWWSEGVVLPIEWQPGFSQSVPGQLWLQCSLPPSVCMKRSITDCCVKLFGVLRDGKSSIQVQPILPFTIHAPDIKSPPCSVMPNWSFHSSSPVFLWLCKSSSVGLTAHSAVIEPNNMINILILNFFSWFSISLWEIKLLLASNLDMATALTFLLPAHFWDGVPHRLPPLLLIALGICQQLTGGN